MLTYADVYICVHRLRVALKLKKTARGAAEGGGGGLMALGKSRDRSAVYDENSYNHKPAPRAEVAILSAAIDR